MFDKNCWQCADNVSKMSHVSHETFRAQQYLCCIYFSVVTLKKYYILLIEFSNEIMIISKK